MDNEKKLFLLALVDESIIAAMGLSTAFLIISGGIALMKWVGVF